jgi:undecaprenyl phosphate N,N'-diacetylbacillosamine 1-phosphate transferase
MYLKFRRVADIVLSFSLLITLFWFLILLSVIQLIVLKSNPIFFQFRIGRGGRIFCLYKFKTMLNEQVPNKLSLFLRNSHIDELPQLINILIGDISFVGPRPLLPEYLALYDAEQAKRHNVLPGLTGLAQVRGGNSLSWNKRFEFDTQYVTTVSFLLDLKILFLTVALLFKSRENKHFSERFTGN